MKKNIVLFVLFVLPIVAYLFFASGVNNFTKLPVLRPNVPELPEWSSLDGKKVSLGGKITVMGFGGQELLKNRGNLFNLGQKVYERYHEFQDLQFVYICPVGTEKDAQYILDQFKAFTNTKALHFVFATPEQIQAYHSSLKLKHKLNADAGTSYVYLFDKKRNLRGRKGDEYKEGYDTFHPSDLSNKMLDDFKVLLYEYKAALKKNRNATKQLGQ
jgi:hypothetical protein